MAIRGHHRAFRFEDVEPHALRMQPLIVFAVWLGECEGAILP
jgi:hypothetical protein